MSPEPDKFNANYLEQVQREEKTAVELRQETTAVTNILHQAIIRLCERMRDAHLSYSQIHNTYLLFDEATIHPAVSGMVLKEGSGILVLGGNNFEKEAKGTLAKAKLPKGNEGFLVSWEDREKLFEIFEGLCLISRETLRLLDREGHPRMPGMIELKHTKSEADSVEHSLEDDLRRSLWQTAYYGASRQSAGMLQIMQKIHAGLNKAGGLE